MKLFADANLHDIELVRILTAVNPAARIDHPQMHSKFRDLFRVSDSRLVDLTAADRRYLRGGLPLKRALRHRK